MRQRLIFVIALSIFLFYPIPTISAQSCATSMTVTGTSGVSKTCSIGCYGSCSVNACVPGVAKGSYTGAAYSYGYCVGGCSGTNYYSSICPYYSSSQTTCQSSPCCYWTGSYCTGLTCGQIGSSSCATCGCTASGPQWGLCSSASTTYSIACSPYDNTWGTSISGNQYYCANKMSYQCNSDCGGYSTTGCDITNCGAVCDLGQAQPCTSGVQTCVSGCVWGDCCTSPIASPAADATCGGSWINQQSLGQASISNPVIQALTDRLIIAAQGTDNGLYIMEHSGTATIVDWYSIGTTTSRPKLVFESNNLFIYFQGVDGFVYKRQYLSQQSWSTSVNTGIQNSCFGYSGPSSVRSTLNGNKIYNVTNSTSIYLTECSVTQPFLNCGQPQLAPNPVYPNTNFNILASVVDGTSAPVTDATVTYTIVKGTGVDCTAQSYPTNQKLNFFSGSSYCSGSDCSAKTDDPSSTTKGQYTVCVNASKPGFLSSYNSNVLSVSTCGNGKIDPDENCRTCPADAGCTVGQVCQPDGVCTPSPPCGNGKIDSGENCITCPVDAGCKKGEACQSDGTCKSTPPVTTCNNNNICEQGESCDCVDCQDGGDGCLRGNICDYNTELCQCNTVSDNVCTRDTNCKSVDPDCSLPTCDSNGICDPYESCGCSDCNNYQDGCLGGDICGSTYTCACSTSAPDGQCPLLDPVCSKLDPDCTFYLSKISVQGNLNILNINWDASGMTNPTSSAGFNCYLNCDPRLPGEDCSTAPYKCSNVAVPNSNICSITNPVYYYDKYNLVICNASNPSTGSFYSYLTTEFKPYDFDLSISNFSVTVGQDFAFPVTIKNTGLFADSFNTTMSENNLVQFTNNTQTTRILYGTPRFDSQQLMFGMKVLALTQSPIGFLVTVNSTTTPIYGKSVYVQLQASSASLPEFDIYGVLQILLFSTLAFTLLVWKKK